MTNAKTTKRALLASVMALILCFTMLLGTTFAWFTDSASTGINTIQLGNLDVLVSYATQSDVVDGAIPDAAWKELDASAPVFSEDALWEPGYTEVVYFKIENAGSMSLKYIMSADIFSETPGINVAGNEYKLSDYLSAYYMTGDKATVFTARSNAQTLDGWAAMIPSLAPATLADAVKMEMGDKALSYEYSLEPDAIAYTTMIIFMPETIGNEANYVDDNKPVIQLGINFTATQYNWEKETDSFDHNYDEKAEYPVADSKGLADAIAAGKDVKLEADITVFEAIQVSDEVTINMNGYNMDASNASSAFIVSDSGSLTINADDEEIELGAAGLVSIAPGADAVIEINGGNFVSDAAASTLIKPDGTGDITIKLTDVNYKSTATTGYALDCSYYDGSNLKVIIEGGSYEATTGLLLPAGSSVTGAEITAKNTKNMQPAVYAMGDMTIENCIIKADKSHAVAVAGGATLTLNNCEVYAGTDANALAFQVFSSGGTINVNNCTYQGKYGTTGKMTAGRVAIINIDGIEVYRKG